MVKHCLATFGPLESRLIANTETPGKRVKAMARFANEAHAKDAAERLNNCPLPFDEFDKLSIKLVYSATFKVTTRIFEAVREAIEAVNTAQKGQHVNFKSFPPTKGHTTLRLEGESQEELSAAEKIVHDIFCGKTVTKKDVQGEKAFWNACFGNRTAGLPKSQVAILGPIEEEFHVAFQCLPAKEEIRVYGTPDNAEKACKALLDIFTNTQNVIRLDDENLQWVIRGGLKDIKDSLGPKNVVLSIWPTLKRIEVIGPQPSWDLAKRLISEKKVASHRRPETTACSVCWTEAEASLTTRCGHAYCYDCFENFCQSADLGSGSGLRCLADSDTCGAVFSLAELQEYLPSLAFEELLASSAKSYINRRPKEFQYCPTTDCERLYRPTTPDHPRAFTCADCNLTICTACRVAHAGMTCPEYRYILFGGEAEFARAKKDLGIKDCPNCNVLIEKAYGCNHMVCIQCRTILCWACLEKFANHASYHNHMMKDHGGNQGDEDEYGYDDDDDDDMY